MSNRAPNALDIFVRRASHPSTPSIAVTAIAAAAATAATAGSDTSPMKPAINPTKTALAAVT